MREEPVDIGSLVRQHPGAALGRPRARSPRRGGRQTDPRRLERIVANLVGNALEHAGRDVAVRVGQDGWAPSSRSPTGARDSTRPLPHVFDRFYKADSSRAGPGSGLGLAIALENARLLGGTLPSGARSAAERGSRSAPDISTCDVTVTRAARAALLAESTISVPRQGEAQCGTPSSHQSSSFSSVLRGVRGCRAAEAKRPSRSSYDGVSPTGGEGLGQRKLNSPPPIETTDGETTAGTDTRVGLPAKCSLQGLVPSVASQLFVVTRAEQSAPRESGTAALEALLRGARPRSKRDGGVDPEFPTGTEPPRADRSTTGSRPST